MCPGLWLVPVPVHCRSQPIVESDSLLFSKAAADTFPFPQYTALFIYSPDSARSGERTHKEEEEGGWWGAAGEEAAS